MSRPERVNDALEFKKLKNTQTAELKAVVASKANQSSEVIVKYVKEKLNAMRIPFLGVMPGEMSGNTVINVHLKHQTYSCRGHCRTDFSRYNDYYCHTAPRYS
jgi:hypothetical protein